MPKFLNLSDITYSYPGSSTVALDGVSAVFRLDGCRRAQRLWKNHHRTHCVRGWRARLRNRLA